MTGEKRRGRPREFDEGEVLQAVLDVFWRKGYSGATLPDLAAAAGVTRPSLYAALGDKRTMYLRSLEHFGRGLRAQIATALDPCRPLADGLLEFYTGGIDLYLSGDHPRGCLVVCTAVTDAFEEEEVRSALVGVIDMLDQAFAERFETEADRRHGAHVDAEGLAKIASATLHSLAVRARAGQSREQLIDLASATTALIVNALCLEVSAHSSELSSKSLDVSICGGIWQKGSRS